MYYVIITSQSSDKTKISFLYGHCVKILVSNGQVVNQGDIIATVVSTGKSTGSHLHLEYMINGTNYDPELYLE